MYNRAYTALDQSDELIHNYHPPLFFFFLSPFVFPTALFSSLHSLPFLLLLSRCPALPLSCPGNGPIEKACCLGHTREAAFIGDGEMEGWKGSNPGYSAQTVLEVSSSPFSASRYSPTSSRLSTRFTLIEEKC